MGLGLEVGVDVGVAVAVGVTVAVGVAVAVGVDVGVGVPAEAFVHAPVGGPPEPLQKYSVKTVLSICTPAVALVLPSVNVP